MSDRSKKPNTFHILTVSFQTDKPITTKDAIRLLTERLGDATSPLKIDEVAELNP